MKKNPVHGFKGSKKRVRRKLIANIVVESILKRKRIVQLSVDTMLRDRLFQARIQWVRALLEPRSDFQIAALCY